MLTKGEKRIGLVILLVQVMILGLLGTYAYLDVKNTRGGVFRDGQSGCFGLYGGVDEARGGYYADEETAAAGLFTCGPYSTIKKGIYEVTVYYESTGTNHVCYAYTEDGENFANALESDRVTLDAHHTVKRFFIWVNRETNDFEVQTVYGGNGTLLIKGITVTKGMVSVIHSIVLWLFLFGIVDVIAFLGLCRRKKLLSDLTLLTGMLLGGIIFFASAPLFRNGLLNLSTDLNFILMRIDGLKDGILSGEFPVRIQPNWLNGYGYATSVFYGDLLLLFPAFLRIAGFSVQDAYHCYVFCINTATCLIAYYCLKGIFRRRSVALVGSGIYTLSAFRLIFIYGTSRGGMFSAYLFLPLVAYGIYLIYHEPQKHRCVFCTAVGMTGVIQSHLLTGEIAVFAIALTILFSVRRFFQKRTVAAMGKAVAVSLLFNLGFLVPLFDYMGEGFYVSSDGWKAIYHYIQKNGESAAGFFSLFHGGNSQTAPDVVWLAGLFLFAVILLLVPASRMKEEDAVYRRFGKVTLAVSVVLLVMGTRYFPWDFLEERFAFLRMPVNSIQYPSRFYSVASIFAVMTVCCGLMLLKEACKEHVAQAIWACVILCGFLSAAWSISTYVNETDVQVRYDTAALDTNRISTKEYLPEGADPDLYCHEEPIADASITISDFTRNGLTLMLQCVNNGSESAGVELPLVYYKGYRAQDEAGTRLCLEPTDNAAVRLTVPGGYAGEITIRFHEPAAWRIAWWVSILSVAAAAAAGMCVCFRDWQRIGAAEKRL